MNEHFTRVLIPRNQYFHKDFPFAIRRTIDRSCDINIKKRFNRTFWKITYIISGEGKYIIGNQKFAFKRNSLLVVHPGADTTYDIKGDSVELYNLVFDRSFLGDDLKMVNDPFHLLQIFATTYSREYESPLFFLTATREIAALIRNIYNEFEYDLTNRKEMIRLRFLELLLLIIRRIETKGHRNPEWTANYVREYIRKNFAADFSVQKLAHELRISPERLSRLYHEYCGTSIMEELKTSRLCHAGDLLRTTNLPVTEIAHASGFNDSAYFFRSFRAFFKTTPEIFRSILLDKNDN